MAEGYLTNHHPYNTRRKAENQSFNMNVDTGM